MQHIWASRGNTGPSVAAFCVRDATGDLKGAKGLKTYDTTNLMAEAVPIKEGTQFCFQQGLNRVILRTDSLALVHILNGDRSIPSID